MVKLVFPNIHQFKRKGWICSQKGWVLQIDKLALALGLVLALALALFIYLK